MQPNLGYDIDEVYGLGYVILDANSGIEALRIVASRQGIDLLLTDVVMPDMRGRELACRVRMEHPTVKVLYLSGYAESSDACLGIGDVRSAFLQKPFDWAALAMTVRSALEEAR